MFIRCYKLVDRKPVLVKSILEAAEVLSNMEMRRVASDYIGDTHISTVFLCLDHNHSGEGEPILFETMIFGGKHNNYMDRCSTYEEALLMHEKALNIVMYSSDSNKDNRLKVEGNNLK